MKNIIHHPGLSLRKPLVLMAVILLFSCEREDKLSHPLVHTGEVTEISLEGARFTGRIVNEGGVDIVDHGFVWGEERDPDLNKSTVLSLAGKQSEAFSEKERAFFLREKIYFVRAFAKDMAGNIYYGRQVSFEGVAELPDVPVPIITGIEPQHPHLGDTLEVFVENSAYVLSNYVVRIANLPVSVFEASITGFRMIVPVEIDVVNPIITLNLFGAIAADKQILIAPPVIESVTPDSGSRADEIEITGKGFHVNKIHNRVLLGNHPLEIISAGLNKLIVSIPFGQQHGRHKLTVETLGQPSVEDFEFMLYEPWRQLNDTPFRAISGITQVNTYEIAGRVFIAGASYENTNFTTVWEYTSTYDSWERRKDMPEYATSGFASTSHGYIIKWEKLYKYNPWTNNWTRKSDLPFYQTPYWFATFSIGNEGYICGGQIDDNSFSKRLVQYNQETDSWTYKKDFPESTIVGGIGFSINNKGFVGLGGIGPNQPNMNLYEYDPSTNSWEIKISFEDILQNSDYERGWSNVFVINNKAFIFSGAMAMGYGWWEGTNDIYEYDPLNNTLRRLPDHPTPPRNGSFSFALDGKGYIGGGRSNYTDLNDFWEFDPSRLPPD